MAYRRTERVITRLAARHNSILVAARALASESGMAAVQIVPVAERAGIAAGTVYRYFPSKDDLVAALVAAISQEEIAAIHRAAAAAPGPLSALAAAIMAFAGRVLQDRRLAWAMLTEAIDPGMNAERLAFRRTLVAEFEIHIRAATTAGHLPDDDATLAAAALVGAVLEGQVGSPPSRSGDPDLRKSIAQSLTLFGLRALGVVDARARGLVVQTSWPAPSV